MRDSTAKRMQLYRASVVVTGPHYSITSLLGEILGGSRQFGMLYEPLNPQPTLDSWTLTRVAYEFFAESDYPAFRDRLIGLMFADGLAGESLARARRIGSRQDLGRWLGFLLANARKKFGPRRVIIKDPFVLFTARTMQRVDRLRVVVGVRHPCAWIESILRQDGGMPIAKFNQPALLDAMPDFAEGIARFSLEKQEPIAEAIFAWKLLHSFEARYLLPDPLTCLVRQDDIVSDPTREALRLFSFLGVEPPDDLNRILRRLFDGGAGAGNVDGSRSYVRRNGNAVLAKWRSRLTADQQALIREETEAIAAEFGYEAGDW